MILFPNAKINLGLNITERRPDNYHNIESLFLPVGWHDILEIVPSRDSRTSLTVYGSRPACTDDDNLVMKAYRAMSALVEIPPVEIYLEKIIPEGAGLGGGSSDAAFTIKGLNELFALGFSDDELASVASSLGADCTFFIYNKPMLASGIGTELSEAAFDRTPYHIVIVKPEVSVSTKEAYAGVTPSPWITPLHLLVSENRISELINDFEASIFPKHPELNDIKLKLLNNGAVYAAMSGSGSAIYGLFTDEEKAQDAARNFNMYPHVFVGQL